MQVWLHVLPDAIALACSFRQCLAVPLIMSSAGNSVMQVHLSSAASLQSGSPSDATCLHSANGASCQPSMPLTGISNGKQQVDGLYVGTGSSIAAWQCTPHDVNTVLVRHCRSCAAVQALREYDGPTCFAIPGNHDWIDGLETFQRHIQHRGWLGGWLLPQENSYFALHLPQGWWVFGLDLALLDDIDLCQCRYFCVPAYALGI